MPAGAGSRARAGKGILESTIECLRRECGVRETELLAWLGPCIGPEAFEVGPEVKAAFALHDDSAQDFFKPHGSGKWLADLQAVGAPAAAGHGHHAGLR